MTQAIIRCNLVRNLPRAFRKTREGKQGKRKQEVF